MWFWTKRNLFFCKMCSACHEARIKEILSNDPMIWKPSAVDWWLKPRCSIYKTFPSPSSKWKLFSDHFRYDIKHELERGASRSSLSACCCSPTEDPCGVPDWLVYSWEAAVQACVPLSCNHSQLLETEIQELLCWNKSEISYFRFETALFPHIALWGKKKINQLPEDEVSSCRILSVW